MDDELHPAALVEEAFSDNTLLRGQGAEHGRTSTDVNQSLLGSGFIEAALLCEEWKGLVGIVVYLLTDFRDSLRQLKGTSGGFAVPERNRGRSALGIFNANAAGLDALDAP